MPHRFSWGVVSLKHLVTLHPQSRSRQDRERGGGERGVRERWKGGEWDGEIREGEREKEKLVCLYSRAYPKVVVDIVQLLVLIITDSLD